MVRRIVILVVVLAILGGGGYAYWRGWLGTLPNPASMLGPSDFQLSQGVQRSGDCTTENQVGYTLSSTSVLLGLPVYIDLQGFVANEQVDLVLARDSADATPVAPNVVTRRTASMKANQCGSLAVEIRATGEQYRGSYLIQAVGRESHKTVGIAQFAIR